MQRAGSLIGKLKLPKGADSPEERAIAAWRIAAGKKVARYTRATRLVRQTLVVEVGDMVWQRQLYSLRKFLLKNLDEMLGPGTVTDLDFRQAPARRGPGQAQSAQGAGMLPESAISGSNLPLELDDADLIRDPVMAMLYKQARRKRQA